MTFMDTINIPILAVNNYIWDQFKGMEPGIERPYVDSNNREVIPFFPLGSDAATAQNVYDQQLTTIYYDRIFRYRPQPFYQIKKEQFSYKIKGVDTEYLAWGSALQLLLDREDDSAKDINYWISQKWQQKRNLNPDIEVANPFPVFFHSMRVFIPAYAEFREVSANDPTWVGQFIVDVQYHMNDRGAPGTLSQEKNDPYNIPWTYVSE